MTAHVLPQTYSQPPLTVLTWHTTTVAVDTISPSTGGNRSSVASAAAHPISCVSSGHVRACDVAAARRHYVDGV